MNKKLELTTTGFILTFLNILFVFTKFNILGLVFGCIAAVYFIKALRIKSE